MESVSTVNRRRDLLGMVTGALMGATLGGQFIMRWYLPFNPGRLKLRSSLYLKHSRFSSLAKNSKYYSAEPEVPFHNY